MAFSKDLIDGLRKAFRHQLDEGRAVDGLPPLTDPEFNWWCAQLKRESRGLRAAPMPPRISGQD